MEYSKIKLEIEILCPVSTKSVKELINKSLEGKLKIKDLFNQGNNESYLTITEISNINSLATEKTETVDSYQKRFKKLQVTKIKLITN